MHIIQSTQQILRHDTSHGIECLPTLISYDRTATSTLYRGSLAHTDCMRFPHPKPVIEVKGWPAVQGTSSEKQQQSRGCKTSPWRVCVRAAAGTTYNLLSCN
eukprot:6477158-Amphidinium_carterae.1